MRISMSEEMVIAMEQQKRAFKEKFGREPGPNDPIFFDPNADTPQFMRPGSDVERHLVDVICFLMERAGIRKALIHAYRKTGRMVTTDNQHLLSRKEIREWNRAVREYEDGDSQ